MNFQRAPVLKSLKVFVVNPLAPASQLVIVKMLSGVVFGNDQLIDLYLIVYSNEVKAADALKLELESCAFLCTSSIKVSSDLLSASDGDVFCFMTDFTNPNCLKLNDTNSVDQFNSLYLVIKLANSLCWSAEKIITEMPGKNVNFEKTKERYIKERVPIERKPIFMTDGLVAMDILKSLSKNMPQDIFFCPSSLTTIAKTVLGDYLNVQCNVINDVLIWAANDEVFHVEVEKPLIIHDESHCNSNVIEKDLLESLNIDSTQFSAAWMKKEFIEKVYLYSPYLFCIAVDKMNRLISVKLCKKVASSASKNPYGCIYRAVEFGKTLRDIWLTRIQDDVTKVYTNMGVISDGSLGTIKGYPYILPIELNKDTWSVNKRYHEDTPLKMEINRMNKAARQHHLELMSQCKKILQENIVNQDLRDEGDSGSSSKY